MVAKNSVGSDKCFSLTSVAVGPENWPNLAHGKSVLAPRTALSKNWSMLEKLGGAVQPFREGLGKECTLTNS